MNADLQRAAKLLKADPGNDDLAAAVYKYELAKNWGGTDVPRSVEIDQAAQELSQAITTTEGRI